MSQKHPLLEYICIFVVSFALVGCSSSAKTTTSPKGTFPSDMKDFFITRIGGETDTVTGTPAGSPFSTGTRYKEDFNSRHDSTKHVTYQVVEFKDAAEAGAGLTALVPDLEKHSFTVTRTGDQAVGIEPGREHNVTAYAIGNKLFVVEADTLSDRALFLDAIPYEPWGAAKPTLPDPKPIYLNAQTLAARFDPVQGSKWNKSTLFASGTVEEAYKRPDHPSTIILAGPDGNGAVAMSGIIAPDFAPDQDEKVLALKKGDSIKYRCTADVALQKILTFKDCKLD